MAAIGTDESYATFTQKANLPELTIWQSGRSHGTVVTHPKGSKTRWFGDATLTQKWMIWTELMDTDASVRRWTMFAYNRDTKSTSVLASAPPLSDNEDPPGVPGFSGQVIAGDSVFWPEVVGRVGKVNSNLYRCQISRCKDTVALVARNSAYPKSTGDAVLFLKQVATSRYEVRKSGIGSDAQVQTVGVVDLAEGEGLNGFAANSDGYTVALVRRSGGARVWSSRLGESGQDILEEESGMFGYPVAGSRFTAWAESSGFSADEVGGYVSIDGRVYSVGNSSGLYGIFAGGELISWQEDTSAGPVAVLARFRRTP
ncbi:hypothetical protein [Nocardioides sp.]|uniref:hypothetical protein n=1 Tax=Nocardioides sp. TaxID=35761 RepID=UPI00261295C9|nr:hypothetical protein [Nocardioides sp.]